MNARPAAAPAGRPLERSPPPRRTHRSRGAAAPPPASRSPRSRGRSGIRSAAPPPPPPARRSAPARCSAPGPAACGRQRRHLSIPRAEGAALPLPLRARDGRTPPPRCRSPPRASPARTPPTTRSLQGRQRGGSPPSAWPRGPHLARRLVAISALRRGRAGSDHPPGAASAPRRPFQTSRRRQRPRPRPRPRCRRIGCSGLARRQAQVAACRETACFRGGRRARRG